MDNDTASMQGEVNALKLLLNDSDIEILKAVESIFACDSALEVAQAVIDAAKSCSETVRKRVAWRARINELEALIEAAPAVHRMEP